MKLEQLDEVEKLKLVNVDLQIENCNLKLFILNHNKEEMLKELEIKYKDKEKENGNDR